ncbi:MAG: DUF4234 domain-containing protein [Proteobacteria bacterium]|nr:DUF4234 domain-containing protein [Pseudomonadota bacterium]MBQ9241921.1 DUF4234 domain-containing protein [Pseudomonadota bacterium]
MEKSFLNTERSIVFVIIAYIFTLGIYGLYWLIRFQNDVHRRTGEGFGGWGTVGICIVTWGIYNYYWYYVTSHRLIKAGVTREDTSTRDLLLGIFTGGIANLILWQLTINEKALSGSPLAMF